jgi:hypothetical protein
MTSRQVLAMRNAFYSKTHTGADRHASRPFSFLETILIESEAKEGKAQSERVIWTWKVHEVAMHEASQGEGLLMMGGSIEPLLKKVSEEVTRKAQEKLKAARSNR